LKKQENDKAIYASNTPNQPPIVLPNTSSNSAITATMEQEQEENQRRLQELMRMLQQPDA